MRWINLFYVAFLILDTTIIFNFNLQVLLPTTLPLSSVVENIVML